MTSVQEPPYAEKVDQSDPQTVADTVFRGAVPPGTMMHRH